MKTSWQADYDVNGASFTVCVNYIYTPGRPAFTPRGEYAPIDPPEPAAVEIAQIGIMEDGQWRNATPFEFALVTEWVEDSFIDDLIEAAEARDEPCHDPENIYDLPGVRQSVEEDRQRARGG